MLRRNRQLLKINLRKYDYRFGFVTLSLNEVSFIDIHILKKASEIWSALPLMLLLMKRSEAPIFSPPNEKEHALLPIRTNWSALLRAL